MNPRLRPCFSAVAAALVVAACGPDVPDEVAAHFDALPPELDYNFDVKPILSDRCFLCHGPDAQKREADLRLDLAEAATAELASGNGRAVVPGDPGASELVRRILSDDPEVVMPTPESHLTLTDRERAVLVRWIDEGAAYKEHWAFTPPERPAVPDAGEGWALGDIDRFVAERHARAGLPANPEAERPYLIRRVFFDLTGLPPTPEQLDRWEADTADDWYERLVDELLASPAYGERMANYWMDVARFADSEGYLDDFHHELWPYRDWVIEAYNANMPYDEFVAWQLGGDQFDEPTQEQILATTFNRTHKQNSEGGIIPEEFRVEYVADRANTVGTAFMGLTVGCARCHDHKYDPFSQADYFRLYGYFNNTIERGDAIFATNGVSNDDQVPHRLAMNAGPTLQLASERTLATRDSLETLAAAGRAELAAFTARLDDAPVSAAQVARAVQRASAHHLTFEPATFERDLAPGGRFVSTELEGAPGRVGQGVLFEGLGRHIVDGEASRFEQSEPFTVSFWIEAPEFFEEAHVLYNSGWRIHGYRGWDVRLDSNRVRLRLNHAHPFQSVDLRLPEPLAPGEWRHVTWTHDGSGSAAGMSVYVDGEPAEPEVLRDYLVRSTRPYTAEDDRALVYTDQPGLIIGGLHYDPDFGGGRLDELRVLNAEAGPLVAGYLYHDPLGTFDPSAATPADRRAFRAKFEDPHAAALIDSVVAWRTRAVEAVDTVREVMVMGDYPEPVRQTRILERGVYDAPGEVVRPGVPENLLPWPDELPRNRLGLARWLTHADNPLTARVAVNQLWYVIFGRGIVETVEDFGNQGALPTHPELLDFLAVRFREGGWDVKALVREMVTSATYRQSSVVRDDHLGLDPDNDLLARSPRYRRSAEMVRDNALASAGLLDRRVGGASAFTYQPPGLWKESNNHWFSPAYAEDVEDGLYRRSLYSFWKRNVPAPAMLVFDASLRSECQVRRLRSNTPLQALVLLNDPQMVEACRVLASATLDAADGEVDDPVAHVFRRLVGRPPTPAEHELLTDYYAEEYESFEADPAAARDYLATGYHDTDLTAGPARVAALARVAGAVLNSTEAYYKS